MNIIKLVSKTANKPSWSLFQRNSHLQIDLKLGVQIVCVLSGHVRMCICNWYTSSLGTTKLVVPDVGQIYIYFNINIELNCGIAFGCNLIDR